MCCKYHEQYILKLVPFSCLTFIKTDTSFGFTYVYFMDFIPVVIPPRSSNVTLQGFMVNGCDTDHAHGIIDADSVHHVMLDSMEFMNNKNKQGPSCLSIRNSTCSLLNISATNNSGRFGGVLFGNNSTITVATSNFQHNKGLAAAAAEVPGATLLLEGGSLGIRDTDFVENISEDGGAAIFFNVSLLID